MKELVIANETLKLRAFIGTSLLETELEIYKDYLYKVEWYDEITEDLEKYPPMFSTRKSFINIIKIRNESDEKTCRKMNMYKLELTREQFEKWFSPIENHSKLYFHRIDLSTEKSNENRCYKVNKFVHDTNIKIDKIFEPDSDTIDIWYTKYRGNW